MTQDNLEKKYCPDCRGMVELEEMCMDYNEEIEYQCPYYRCPKCRQEYELEDL